MVLGKTLENPLSSREVKSVLKQISSECSLEVKD